MVKILLHQIYILHGHLFDCLFDSGPIYSFWLLSFEREKGTLRSYLTNRKQIETQVMKKTFKGKFG